MDGRASYCVYATNNGNSTIWFLFRVAPVSEDIRLACHVHSTRDLRETRMYTIDTVLENDQASIKSTPHTYRNTVIFVPVDQIMQTDT